MTETGPRDPANDLTHFLCGLRSRMADAASARQGLIDAVHPEQRDSARNLIHYLALRRDDLRAVQEALGLRGLSSLARVEAHALASVDAVLAALHRLDRRAWEAGVAGQAPVSPAEARRLLRVHAEALLGKGKAHGVARVMVTTPSEAAGDYGRVRDLLAAGMDCMRINCAHDGPDAWEAMVNHVRKAQEDLGRPCTVHMDLGGLKLRTGKVQPGPAVLKIKPRRDEWGRVIAPAVVRLRAEGSEPDGEGDAGTACLPVDPASLRRLQAGHRDPV